MVYLWLGLTVLTEAKPTENTPLAGAPFLRNFNKMFNRIKEKIEYLRGHWFVKNLIFFQAGNFAANLTQALIGVFIVRLLQPENYGIYTLAFSLFGFMTVFLSLGAQSASTTLLSEAYAKNDKEKTKEVLAFLVKITLILTVPILFGALFAPWLAGIFYNNYKIGIYAAILLIASAIGSTFFLFSMMVLQITRWIKTMTILTFSNQFSKSIFSLLLVVGGFGVLGAIVGHLLSAIIILFTSVILWGRVSKQYPIFPSARKLIGSIKSAPVKKYLGFSFWITADSNLANLYNVLPIMLTGIFVTTSEVTFFKLAFGYINLALTFLSPISSLLNVEFPKMKVAEDGKDKLLKNFVRTSLYSFLFSVVLTVGAIITAPFVFHILYGANFNPSIKYVAGLFFYGATMGMGVGFGPMWRAINKVKISIIINAITLSVGVPIGLLLIQNFGLWGTVIWVSVIFNVSHIASYVLILRELKRTPA